MQNILIFLLLSTAYVALATPVLQEVDREYPRHFEYTDEDGVVQTLDLEAEPDIELLSEITRNPANNKYLLFTRRNPTSSQELIFNNADSITSSNFNPNVPTVVISHGWLGGQNNDINPTIRDAFLRKTDVNVIVLDWRRLALSNYVTAANGVPAVGRGLGQFLAYLNGVTRAPYDSLHLVGFSLGAHLVGNAGRAIGGRAARVTGLDPAGPLWNYNSNKLNKDDGVYVEAIHTDGGYLAGGLGIGSAVAQADFFPNGGISQPGCLTNVCNHERAWKFFASSITYNHFIGKECSSSLQITLNRCSGQELRMGNDNLRKTGSGLYRLDTGRRYPY